MCVYKAWESSNHFDMNTNLIIFPELKLLLLNIYYLYLYTEILELI